MLLQDRLMNIINLKLSERKELMRYAINTQEVKVKPYSFEYNRPAYIVVVEFDDCEIQIYYIECKFEDEYGDWEESYRFISSVQKLTY